MLFMSISLALIVFWIWITCNFDLPRKYSLRLPLLVPALVLYAFPEWTCLFCVRWTGPPRFWERTPRPRRLLKASATKTQPLATTLEVRRDPVTGKVSGFVEVPVKGAGDTAKNSTSMARRPGPPDQVLTIDTFFIHLYLLSEALTMENWRPCLFSSILGDQRVVNQLPFQTRRLWWCWKWIDGTVQVWEGRRY